MGVLRALLGALSAPTVLRFYVEVPPTPLPALLGALLPSPEILEGDARRAEAARRDLDDVASLVSLAGLAVGPRATVDRLLPDVDRFFEQLAHLRRSVVRSAANLVRHQLAADCLVPRLLLHLVR